MPSNTHVIQIIWIKLEICSNDKTRIKMGNGSAIEIESQKIQQKKNKKKDFHETIDGGETRNNKIQNDNQN